MLDGSIFFPSVTIGSIGYHVFKIVVVFFPLLLPSYLRLPRFQDSGSTYFPPVTQLPSVTIGYHIFKIVVVFFPLLLPSYLRLPSVTFGSFPPITQLPLVTIGSIGYHIFKIVVRSIFPPPVTQLPSVTSPPVTQLPSLSYFIVSCFSP